MNLLAWMKEIRQLVEEDASNRSNNRCNQSAEGHRSIMRRNWSLHNESSRVTEYQCFETVEKVMKSRRETKEKMRESNSNGTSLKDPDIVPWFASQWKGAVNARGRSRGGLGRNGWSSFVSGAVILRNLLVFHMSEGMPNLPMRWVLLPNLNIFGWFENNWMALRCVGVKFWKASVIVIGRWSSSSVSGGIPKWFDWSSQFLLGRNTYLKRVSPPRGQPEWYQRHHILSRLGQ